LYDSLPTVCSDEVVVESGHANGWSAVLLLNDQNPNNRERVSRLNRAAKKAKRGDANTVELPPEVSQYADFIRSLLRRQHGIQPH
jgi:hypothetical protein